MALTPDQAARAIVAAKQLKEEAEKAYRQAEAQLREAYGIAGISFTVVDGEKVNLIETSRNSYDTDALQKLVSPKIFKQVTVAKIDSDLLKSALKLGVIKQDVVDTVTETKLVMSVRITAVDAESKSTTIKKEEVA
ncbi:MAG: hypothetical protein ACO3CH_00070 [Ilumatobacteraceae bacterium]|nr:hypothetical protein [Chitinophagales bacterium]